MCDGCEWKVDAIHPFDCGSLYVVHFSEMSFTVYHTTWCHIPVDSIFLLLSALLLSLELPLFWLLVVAGVHSFFKQVGATSKFQVPEG